MCGVSQVASGRTFLTIKPLAACFNELSNRFFCHIAALFLFYDVSRISFCDVKMRISCILSSFPVSADDSAFLTTLFLCPEDSALCATPVAQPRTSGALISVCIACKRNSNPGLLYRAAFSGQKIRRTFSSSCKMTMKPRYRHHLIHLPP